MEQKHGGGQLSSIRDEGHDGVFSRLQHKNLVILALEWGEQRQSVVMWFLIRLSKRVRQTDFGQKCAGCSKQPRVLDSGRESVRSDLMGF